MNQFTPERLSDWLAYERVRKSGKYNMYDKRARQKAGLTGEQYSFVMEHFSDLAEAVKQKQAGAE